MRNHRFDSPRRFVKSKIIAIACFVCVFFIDSASDQISVKSVERCNALLIRRYKVSLQEGFRIPPQTRFIGIIRNENRKREGRI